MLSLLYNKEGTRMSTKTYKISTHRVEKILNQLRNKTWAELRSPRVEKGKK